MEQASTAAESARQAQHQHRYQEAVQGHERALALIQRIATEFPDSSTHAALKDNRHQVGPYTVGQLRNEALPRAQLYQQATHDISACAIAVALRGGDAEVVAVLRALAETAVDLAAIQLGTSFVRETEHRPAALAALAEAQHRTGQRAAAASTMQSAIVAAAEIGDLRVRHEQWATLALRQARIAGFPSALQTARKIQSASIRARALRQLGLALAEADRGEEASPLLFEALQSAKEITAERTRGEELLALARIYARGGATEGAATLLHTVRTLANSTPIQSREALLLPTIALWAKLGDPTRALALCPTIATATRRSEALVALLESGHLPGEHLLTAYEIATGIEHDQARSRALYSLAGALMQAGMDGEARASAETIPAPRLRAKALTEIAADPSALLAAETAVRGIFEETDRAAALTSLASKTVQLGDSAGGSRLLNAAWGLATGADAAQNRAARLLRIAGAAFEARQRSVAEGALTRALRQALAIEDAMIRAGELRQVAQLALMHQVTDILGDALPMAIVAAGQLEFEGTRARALMELTQLLMDSHQPLPQVLQQLREAAEGISAPNRRGPLQRQIALALASRGLTDDALELVQTTGAPAEFESALSALARTHLERGEGLNALRIVARLRQPAIQAGALVAVARAVPTASVAERALLQKILEHPPHE